MATAKRLPSGSYRVNQYINTVNGKRIYKSFTASNKKDAEYAALEYVKNYKRMQEPANLTVGEAVDKYIDNKTAILSPSTIREYRRSRKNYLQEIMNTALSDLTQSGIQQAVNTDAVGHSPKTIRNAHGLLSATLAEFYPDFRLRTKLPAKKKFIPQMPTEEAIKQIMDKAGIHLRAAIIASACGGLRRSEISALERSDLLIDQNKISVSKALVLDEDKNWVIKGPKTYESCRTIKVPKFVIDELLNLPSQEGRLIPITPDSITHLFWELRQKLGFKFRLHDLRHHNASIMLVLGVPDKYAMERMGHATTHMLKTVYQHTLDEHRGAIDDKLNKQLEMMYATRNATHKNESN